MKERSDYMEILIHEANKDNVLLTADYRPNPAMQNEFQTQFFTCKLIRIELAGNELMDYMVDEDAQFLILHLSIHNITNEIISMFKEDFLIRYDEEGPFEAEDAFGIAKQLPDTYALKPDEVRSGKLIFIVSKATKKICFTYTEYFDDESEGKSYKLKYAIK